MGAPKVTKGNGISVDELKKGIARRLDGNGVKYLLDVCEEDTKPPEDYFIGFPSVFGSTSDAEFIVSKYPEAAQRFIEMSDLHFQPGKVAITGIINSLEKEGYDKQKLNKKDISGSFERLLLISMDAFYDPLDDSFSADFDIMVGRAQIRHERTDARYRFETKFPINNSDKLESRLNQFLQQKNNEGKTIAAWHGLVENGFWVKLFRQQNRQSKYNFEPSTSNQPNIPKVTTESTYPVKTFAAEVKEIEDGVIIQTFDKLERSGMKKSFRLLLQRLADDPSGFENWNRVQSTNAKNLVESLIESAESAANEDEEDVDVAGDLQDKMDEISDDVESNLDEVDEGDKSVKRQLENDTPTFVGFNIENDQATGIEQFRVRSEGPFADFGGQIEEFNEATRSLLREADKENIRLAFRMDPPDEDRPSFFTVGHGDWKDFRGVSQDVYDTLKRLFDEENE
ncbi:hypothetical protein [Haloferax gibbonsii]|uniref:hypothetical protein n=1 Tax=Haloferax gibbonsii TaxID=35746 RepID=UPI000AEF709A|nr:hypothetical protein [Haloferax gibbonsii]